MDSIDKTIASLKDIISNASKSGTANVSMDINQLKTILSNYENANYVFKLLYNIDNKTSITGTNIKTLINQVFNASTNNVPFVRRTSAPSKDNKFYYSDKNIFTASNYGMPNCTCYAHGRYAELTGIWLPRQCWGNAEDWFAGAQAAGLLTSSTPVLGAIACWKVGQVKNGKDGAGHVAIVEYIAANADITTSNSAYKSTEWYEQTIKASNGYNWTSNISGKKYEFLGFIIPPIVFTEPKAVMTVNTALNLRLGPGTKNKSIGVMKKSETFYYDGNFIVVDNMKWLHGIYSKGIVGWASAKYMSA